MDSPLVGGVPTVFIKPFGLKCKSPPVGDGRAQEVA